MLDRNLRLEIYGELGLTSSDSETTMKSFPIVCTAPLLLCIVNTSYTLYVRYNVYETENLIFFAMYRAYAKQSWILCNAYL